MGHFCFAKVRQPKLSNGGVCTRRVQAVASLGYKLKLCLLPRTPFWRTPEWLSVPESLALTKSKILCAPRVARVRTRVELGIQAQRFENTTVNTSRFGNLNFRPLLHTKSKILCAKVCRVMKVIGSQPKARATLANLQLG